MVEMKVGKLAIRRDGVTGTIEATGGGYPFRVLWADGRSYHYDKDGVWVLAKPLKRNTLNVIEVCDLPSNSLDEIRIFIRSWLAIAVDPIVRVDNAVKELFAVALSGGLGYLIGSVLNTFL